jgi:hypothetical protein
LFHCSKCQKESEKEITKPKSYRFDNIDLEFKFIENKYTKKIGNNDLKNIKKLISSVKNLLTSLIYTNLSKKKIDLNQRLLDNFDIEYNYNEPILHKSEKLNKG